MDDRLVQRRDGPTGRMIRSAAKLLARVGFVVAAVSMAPQIRAMGRAGHQVDWTFGAPALAAFAIGFLGLCVFWTRDALRARRERPRAP